MLSQGQMTLGDALPGTRVSSCLVVSGDVILQESR